MNVPETIQLCKKYHSKPENGVGGSLHIILDDGNIGNNHIEFCKEEAIKNKDKDGIILCDVFSKLSKTQRRKVVNSYELYG